MVEEITETESTEKPTTEIGIEDDSELIKRLLPVLMGDLKLKVVSALETGSMDDAMDLAEELIQFSQNNNTISVGNWAVKLKELVDGFDIEGMLKHMTEYEKFILMLRDHAAEGGE